MKKAFLLISAAMGISALQAQIKEGTIVYERKINTHRNMPNEQMRAMVPEFRISKHLLIFSDSISVYRMIPENEAPDPFAGGAGAGGGGGVRMSFTMGGSNDAGDLYKNFTQSKSILSSELAGKSYLVVDSITQQPWKLTNETKQILGYTCLKATRKITVQAAPMRMMVINGPGGNTNRDTSRPQPREIELVAWYAQDIASPVGPENHGQLPGVILELDTDNGATVYKALEFKKQVDQKQLKEPKKGKTVTAAEFSKMRMDLMQQQIQNGGIRIGG
ncbi:MAG: GLPGLI family protein [Sediminibacterium sp. Gen4]|jgi:GLPGLI family protein|uniref:GLPGLI family protein n=1 Tax=unclassified Sediminibacterium TaxID=2635961 RepID=UPI0015BC2D1D|nr:MULTISPECIES: GLPGLI family protein [unclassified Sediminibacterium]MBW0160874.1 GLPGLI family protein [Sediminibacterium sp.]MBW0163008.1 GLPGLI family protein [Sediminibacterium sp.]NWK66755.1 GLPGLI family protein [Sediminibacterium sp. Gen4]